jgi:HEAT repeat protein
MQNVPSRYLILSGLLIGAFIAVAFFYFSSPPTLPDPFRNYTFAEYTAARSEFDAFGGPYDEKTIDVLIEWFVRGNDEMGEISRRKLIEISAANEGHRNQINSKLISRLSNECVESRPDVARQPEFRFLRTAVNILADQKVPEALDLLIECSTIQADAGTWGERHLATYSALEKFGEIAEPTLMNKYDTARPELRRSIVSMIFIINSPKIVEDLKVLRTRENDPELLRVIDNLIKRTEQDKSESRRPDAK